MALEQVVKMVSRRVEDLVWMKVDWKVDRMVDEWAVYLAVLLGLM